MSPEVTVLILNWNGKKYLEQFLPSVMATDYPNFKVLLTDNASTDDSVEFVRANYPEVEILELDQNYGFAEGNNRALPHIKSDYYALLNSDVEVTPNWLTPLVEQMEKHPNLASIQPKIRMHANKGSFEYAGASGGWMDSLGYPFCRGRLFDVAEQDEAQYQSAEEIFWATGACCLIRKSVTDKIGLFEPRYFAHMEEIDFCWRAKNFGYQIMVEPRAMVYHVGGGTLNKTNPRKTFLNARNSLITLFKNTPWPLGLVKVYVRLLLDGVWAMRSLLRFDFGTILAIVKAHWSFFFQLPYWIKRRKAIYSDLKKFPNLKNGLFRGSVVWHHFVKGVKAFSALPSDKLK